MIMKAPAALINDYSSISTLAKETLEPIDSTKSEEEDLVVMSLDANWRFLRYIHRHGKELR